MHDTSADTGTYTQAQVELEALVVLSSATTKETVSDAVDVHLDRIERNQGRPIDRAAIPCATMWEVVTLVRDDQDQSP